MRRLGLCLAVALLWRGVERGAVAQIPQQAASGEFPPAISNALIVEENASDAVASPCPWRADLLVGIPTGLRVQRAFNGEFANTWLGEGFVGLVPAPLVAVGVVGGGIRRNFTPVCGRSDTLIFGPGVDGYVLFTSSDRGGGMVAADFDLIWQHAFGKRFGGELGLKLGVGAGVMERWGIIPIAGVFAGCRF